MQYFAIPYVANTAVSIWRPVSTTTSFPTTDTTQLSTPLPSKTQTTSPTTFTTPTPSLTQGTTSDKPFAIGLGVGLPLGVLLIGAIAFLGRQLQRYNNRHTSNTQREISQGSNELVPIHKSELDASLPVQVVSEWRAFPRQTWWSTKKERCDGIGIEHHHSKMAVCECGSFEKDAFGRRGWKGEGKSLLRKAERPASCVEIISRPIILQHFVRSRNAVFW